MRMPLSMRRRLRRPSRIALLLGLGTLSAAGARVDALAATPDPASVAGISEGLLIRTDGTRIYLSERGSGFHELRLPASSHADLLRLLREHQDALGSDVIRLSPMMLAGAGGNSISWAPPKKAEPANPPATGNINTGGAAATPDSGKPAAPTTKTGKTAARDRG